MKTASRTCRLLTLGCKVNQYETQFVKEMLEVNGYREASAREQADLCVVNTCTVTSEADAKSRQAVRRLAQENPLAAIVVMGCYATRDPESVARLPGVAKVITDKEKILDELRSFGVTHQHCGISRFDGHQRAFVKVQDGCLLHCSYCIIPQVRPTVRSRPVEEIVEEVERLTAGGCQEIVLTGIHLGHYGVDLSRGKPKIQWRRLWHLLEELCRLPSNFRIRLSSLEAAEARDDLVRVMATHKRICPHLHLCLQSGSDRILGLMKRRYRSAGFLERCRRIRESLPNPAFTTDVIIGFPGEEDADFEATLKVVREVGFCKTHIFSYSPRQGTPAASMRQTVPPATVAARRQQLLDLEAELRERFLDNCVGQTFDVLVEGSDPIRPGWARGTSCRHVPVSFPGHVPALIRRRVTVRALQAAEDGLIGEPEPADCLIATQPLLETFGQSNHSRIALPLLG
jgi:threonylcarbamoyladenosine tRNA methylthiotransferase MtaB